MPIDAYRAIGPDLSSFVPHGLRRGEKLVRQGDQGAELGQLRDASPAPPGGAEEGAAPAARAAGDWRRQPAAGGAQGPGLQVREGSAGIAAAR